MYTLSQLRSRVNALKRKLALELQILRIHRIAEDFSLRWTRAAADRQPLPETHPFIRHIADNGFRFDTFMDLHRYLERCRDNGDTPDCWGIIRALYSNHDLDRISQMVEKCHALAQPDPDEDSEWQERPPLNPGTCSLIYWADRAFRRYAASAAAFRTNTRSGSSAGLAPGPDAHQTSRAFRRRQLRQQKNPPLPQGEGPVAKSSQVSLPPLTGEG